MNPARRNYLFKSNSIVIRFLIISTVIAWAIPFLGLLGTPADAQGASGNWVSTRQGEGATDDTGMCTWSFDAEMNIPQSGSAVDTTIYLTARSVVIKDQSWATACNSVLDKRKGYRATGTVSGKQFFMDLYLSDGSMIPTLLIINGNKMTGGGTGEDSSGASHHWDFDLTNTRSAGNDVFEPIAILRDIMPVVAFTMGLWALAVGFQPLPRDRIGDIEGRLWIPARTKLGRKRGAPVSMTQHIGSIMDLPRDAVPIPSDHPMLQLVPGQQTNVLQRIPCPYCPPRGPMDEETKPLVYVSGKFYCTNPACPHNRPGGPGRPPGR